MSHFTPIHTAVTTREWPITRRWSDAGSSSPYQLARYTQAMRTDSGGDNNFQLVDKLDISPQARQALDTMMARQDMAFAQQTSSSLSDAEKNYVYDGTISRTLQRTIDGQGSIVDVVSALQARGQRMQTVEMIEQVKHQLASATQASIPLPDQRPTCTRPLPQSAALRPLYMADVDKTNGFLPMSRYRLYELSASTDPSA